MKRFMKNLLVLLLLPMITIGTLVLEIFMSILKAIDFFISMTVETTTEMYVIMKGGY